MSDWRADALCAVHDPELWHPAGKSVEADAQARKAKAICSQCPVKDECLEWAVKAPSQTGVCGGTTEKQRAEMRKRARREGADRLVSARIAQRRKQVAWLSSRGLQPHQIASRMGETVSVVSKDLKRLKDAA